VQEGRGPGALVQLDLGGESLLARITLAIAGSDGNQPGALFAVIKSVAVAQGDVGTGTVRPGLM
jgi:molybdate transport system ATP-binding protein